jgi:hypothetical protein
MQFEDRFKTKKSRLHNIVSDEEKKGSPRLTIVSNSKHSDGNLDIIQQSSVYNLHISVVLEILRIYF